MKDNLAYVKLNMICDIAVVLVEDYDLTVTEAIRYISDTSVLYSIDKNPEISWASDPKFWAKLIYDYNKKLESLGIEYKRVAIEHKKIKE